MGTPPALFRGLAAVCLGLSGCVVETADPAEPADCVDCADAAPDGAAPAPEPPAQPACLDERPPLDLLLVIDNSGSMCEEQDALGQAFEAFHAAIGEWDWRLAVVSTDMNPDNGFRGAFGASPALPVPSLNCLDAAGEPHVPDTEDCRDVDGVPVLDSRFFEPDELARRFRCMVNLGTHGDGFEKALAAADLSLDCGGPNADLLFPCGAADPQFLRPGAALAVIYIGDEDDCSAPVDDMASGRMVDCDPETARCEIPRTENNSCVWYADDLIPVQTYVERLRRVNPDAAAVTALTLSGPRFAPIDGHPVRFEPGPADPMCVDDADEPIVDAACCPEGRCTGAIPPVCEGGFGAAFAGNRLRAMTEAFPGGCVGRDCSSICAPDDMNGLAGQLALKLSAALPPPCE